MSASLTKFGACIVESITGGSSCTVDSFWKDQTCIITMFRRFGCKFCRLEATNLSKMKAALDKRNIRLIGIGFDKDGLTEFQEGNYFHGDLYMDSKRQTYETMGFKRVSRMSGFMSLFNKNGRQLNSDANSANVSGNLAGDGWQTGGLLVVDKDGQCLYEFRQKQVVDHPDYEQIMKILNIDPAEVIGLNKPACTDQSCNM